MILIVAAAVILVAGATVVVVVGKGPVAPIRRVRAGAGWGRRIRAILILRNRGDLSLYMNELGWKNVEGKGVRLG